MVRFNIVGGTYIIVGGTGAYVGASGNGTYTASGTEVFKRIDGVCDTTKVRSFAVVFTLTGPLTLP